MLIKAFREQVRKRPDKIAVKAGEYALTYSFLDEYGSRLARAVSQSCAPPVKDRAAALLMRHNESMIVGIIGVLKSGMVYIPFDPTYPEERLTYMLKDSNSELIVTNNENIHLAVKLRDNTRKPIAIVNVDKIDLHAAAENVYVEREPDHAAYILYTSGSTGRPKGVVQNYKNISYYAGNWSQRFSVSDSDRMVQFASFSHDGAVPDIYSSLLNGATLNLFDVKQKANIESPAQWLNKERITIWHSVPTWYRYFVNTLTGGEVFPYLRLIVLGGEPVREHDVIMFKKYFPHSKFGNIYGQTESTVNSIWLLSPGDDFKKVLIGEPINETGIFVINSDGGEVEAFEVGEIIMAGHYLSPGYLNNGEATYNVFSQDEEFGSLYWSGDLGRLLPDGNIEILGRKDHQVKVRGFRIEPGEIETVLLHHPDISEAVVTAKESDGGSVYGTVSGDRNLWAYLVSPKDFTSHDLREFLAGELPDYMIPSYYVKLDTMPLTPTGKIDKKSLDARGTRLGTGTPYAPPDSETEKILTRIWKKVLKIDKISIDDNFFALGGSSMDVITLNSELQKTFKQTIPAVAIFQYLTIRSFAQYLNRQELHTGKIIQGMERAREKVKIEAKPEAGETGLEIAVIGMAGRFPGAKNIEEFWENLKNGVESISFFSDEELTETGVARELLQNPRYVKAQVNLDNVEYFDAFFFGYNPREAEIMDPQMRIFHECAWHALEDAGYDPYSFEKLIGLYAGASVNYPWLAMSFLSGQGDAAGLFAARQLFDKEYLCTRVAYKLNLRGTAVSVQTACSTSLVAIHMACQGLLGRECRMALAGGVSIPVTAKEGFIYREGMIFSSDGHCRTFDAKADGTIFGNGAGVVVLKRLREARRDRDSIYAVIKGSFTNNDGLHRGGFTAPSAAGEAEVIQTALQMARVEPESIGYLETHGTATALGDPIEIEGLKLAFNTNKKGFCAIGSVKTNIGHLNMAAGVTGFIKTVLALNHRIIPPSLHFETPNPAIDFENSPFYVNTCLTPWKNEKYPRRAGVSSFGIGGTNAHVVLEEWPHHSSNAWRTAHGAEHKTQSAEHMVQGVKHVEYGTLCQGRGGVSPPDQSRQYQLMLLSARTETALDRMTWNLAEFLKKNQDVPLADIAYTLMKGRKVFEHRRMLVCQDTDDAVRKLTSTKPGKVHSSSTKEERKPVIFMFSGLGAQYVNMGRDLYETEPLFREEMDRCFEILNSLMGYDLKEILYPDDSGRGGYPYLPNPVNSPLERGAPQGRGVSPDINQTEIAQPLVFAFEYALAKLLMAWGIKPHGMIGYSFGEYAAACISGVFTLEDALKMIVSRGQLVKKIEPGAMLSVPLPADKLKPFLDNNHQLSLAIDNGPSCIIAGAAAAVDAFEKEMKQNRTLCMAIQTARALHSAMMTPILKEFAETVAKEVTLNKPQIPYISNVTGGWTVPADVSEPAYWASHLAGTVRFADGVRELMKIENAVFLEIGPGRDLSTLLVRHIEGKPGLKTTNLVKHREQDISDVYFLLNKLGRLWLWGVAIDWEQLFRGEKRYRVSLPKYPFERTSFPIRNLDEKAVSIFSRQPLPEKNSPAGAMVTDTVPEAAGRPDMETEYVSPRNEIEQQIAQTWAEFFGFEPIGIDDDFFELGGDSLKALIVITKMNKALGIELSMDEFFRNPTVRSLASSVSDRVGTDPDREEQPLFNMLDAAAETVKKLKESGTDPAEVEADLIKHVQQPVILLTQPDQKKLFCFPPVLGFGAAYKSLAAGLVDYSLYAFNFIEDQDRLNKYIPMITGIQPDGPYVLLGYSAGGKITFEMARAMENHNLEVSDVILLDYFWTAKRVEGDPEGAIESIGKDLDEAGVGFLKETISNKIKKYREYYAAQTTVEVVNANVHLILSRENKDTPHAGCWDGLTTKASRTYQGFGEHTEMVNPGAVEKNAEIIRKILGSCQFLNDG